MTPSDVRGRARHLGDGRRPQDLGDVRDLHRVRLAREHEREVLGAPARLAGAPRPRASRRDSRLDASVGHPHQPLPPLGGRREEARLARREHLFDERGHVEDERHALVAELGRAGEAAHALQRLAERLDDDVLLADELVDDEAEAPVADLRDDDERRARAARRALRGGDRRRGASRRQIGSDAPRTVSTSRASTVRTWRLVERDRLLDARERHARRGAPPISTRSTLMIASVIGSVIVIFVPMPTSLAMSTTPPSLRDVRLDDVEAHAAAAQVASRPPSS